MARVKTAVLVSGNGSNLQALMDAAKSPDYPAEISLVISNKADAYALERARNAGIAATVIPHETYPAREAFEDVMHKSLVAHNIRLICLAGFMRILSASFVEKWPGRILNIHPSLLPRYRGLNAVEQALEAGESEIGCTVHIVTAALDDGPILKQKPVAVVAGESKEDLLKRLHAAEHEIYPAALKDHALTLKD